MLKFLEEQQQRRLALVKEEERIRQEVIRLVKETGAQLPHPHNVALGAGIVNASAASAASQPQRNHSSSSSSSAASMTFSGSASVSAFGGRNGASNSAASVGDGVQQQHRSGRASPTSTHGGAGGASSHAPFNVTSSRSSIEEGSPGTAKMYNSGNVSFRGSYIGGGVAGAGSNTNRSGPALSLGADGGAGIVAAASPDSGPDSFRSPDSRGEGFGNSDNFDSDTNFQYRESESTSDASPRVPVRKVVDYAHRSAFGITGEIRVLQRTHSADARERQRLLLLEQQQKQQQQQSGYLLDQPGGNDNSGYYVGGGGDAADRDNDGDVDEMEALAADLNRSLIARQQQYGQNSHDQGTGAHLRSRFPDIIDHELTPSHYANGAAAAASAYTVNSNDGAVDNVSNGEPEATSINDGLLEMLRQRSALNGVQLPQTPGMFAKRPKAQPGSLEAEASPAAADQAEGDGEGKEEGEEGKQEAEEAGLGATEPQ